MKTLRCFLIIILIIFTFTGNLFALDDSKSQEIETDSIKKDITLSGTMTTDKKEHWLLQLDAPSKKIAGLDQVEVLDGANYVINREWIGSHLVITADLVFPKPKFEKPFLTPDFLNQIQGYPSVLKQREIFPAGIEEMKEDSPEVTLKGIFKIVDDIDYFIPNKPINARMQNGTFQETFYGSDKLEIYDWPKKMIFKPGQICMGNNWS